MALVTHFAGTIDPGETDVRVNVQFPTASLSSGTVTLVATLDPANLLSETNRGNNAGTRTFRITR
jgi:subtilase family serine protease